MVEVSEDPRNENLCRICMEACGEKSPCSCSGSSGYVHITCLSRWAREKLKHSSEVCEICKATYSEPTLSILKQIESEKALARREIIEPSLPWFIRYKWYLIFAFSIAVIGLGLGLGLGIGLKGGISVQRAKEGGGGYSR